MSRRAADCCAAPAPPRTSSTRGSHGRPRPATRCRTLRPAPHGRRAAACATAAQKAVTDRDLHELMPCGVELHLVDSVAEPVVCAELRRVGVGLEAPADRLLGAGQVAEVGDQVLRPRRALALHRLAQGLVGLEKVVVDEWRRLVQDLVVDADSTSCASSATSLICSMRSAVSTAMPATTSVSTPASRNSRIFSFALAGGPAMLTLSIISSGSASIASTRRPSR